MKSLEPKRFWSKPGSRNSSEDSAVYCLVCNTEKTSAAPVAITVQTMISGSLRRNARSTVLASAWRASSVM